MKEITIYYTVTECRELSFDIDELIKYVVDDLRKEDKKISLYSICPIFGDNIEYYLEKSGIIDESVELSEEDLDSIYDEFYERADKLYPNE